MAIRDLFTASSKVADLEKKLDLTSTSLTTTKDQLTQIQKQYHQTVEELDMVIRREQGTAYTYQSIARDYASIGDPYLYNLWVRRSVDVIANNCAALGMEFIDKNTEEVLETGEHEVIKLFDFINDEDSREDFIADIVRWLYRTGTSHILLSDNLADPFIEQPTVEGLSSLANNTPLSADRRLRFIPLKSDRVEPYFVLGQLKFWRYVPGNAALQSKPYMQFYPDQILFIRYKHPDWAWHGLSPISAAVKETLQEFYAHVYNIKNFQNGAMGKGAWVDPTGRDLTPAQKKEAQMAADNEFNTGVDGAGKTIVLQRRLEWIRTSETNRDLEYVNLLNKMRDDILAAMGVPKVLFATSEATFANLNEAKRIFWSQTILPVISKIEKSFNTNFFDKYNIPIQMRFQIEKVAELQEDANVRIDSFKKLVDCGVPPNIAAETTGVPLPQEGWAGWDAPKAAAPSPFGMSYEPDTKKSVELAISLYDKKKRIEEENKIAHDPYYKDMEYKRFIDTILDEEKKISNITEAHLGEVWKSIEKWISQNEAKSIKVKDYKKALLSPNYIAEIVAFIKSLTFNKGYDAKLKGRLEEIFTKGTVRTAMGVGEQIPNVKIAEKALLYYSKRARQLGNVPIQVQDMLVSFLKKESFTIDDFAAALSKKFDDYSEAAAKRVARTESTMAYNAGRLEGMKELKIQKKMWSTSKKDSRVRDSHQIDGEVVNVDEPFSNSLMYPGDQTAGPGECVNCRCVLLSVIEGEDTDANT